MRSKDVGSETSDAPPGLDRLLELFRLRKLGEGRFEPTVYPGPIAPFIFGGQQLGQAVSAAAATVRPEMHLHSLHSHFLAAGDPREPLELSVVPLRDGRSFCTRRIDVHQLGSLIMTAVTSYNLERPGQGSDAYQTPMPPAPDPRGRARPWTDLLSGQMYFSGLELRETGPSEPLSDGSRIHNRQVWFRTAEPLPLDATRNVPILAFASDLGVTSASEVTAGLSGRARILTSLDHALWVHRPFRVDEWILFTMVPVSNASSRGMVRGTFHSIDGVLIASMTQETLIR